MLEEAAREPGALPSSSSSSSQARARTRARPVSGFSPDTTSPFHFGASPPPPSLLTARRAIGSFPAPTTEEGKGLPVLTHPRVASCKTAWLKQVDHLLKLPGADRDLLMQVRAWVQHGVKAVFSAAQPRTRRLGNSSTFRSNEKVCLERMRVYEDMGAMRRVAGLPPAGSHVQPLHAVVRPGKKARVVVDLSQNWNDSIQDSPFQMSSVQEAMELLQRAREHSLSSRSEPASMVKLDITACFLSFPVHKDDLKFFFCEAGGDYYQFLSLVFGRKDAPRVVSQLLDVVSSAMTDAGIAHVRYLDDFLVVGTTAARAWASAHLAAHILIRFGLALSPGKVEGPSRCLEFLGIVIDTEQEVLAISAGRQEELTQLLNSFRHRKSSSVRRLQSLLGKLSFASTVLPGARPFLRRIIDLCKGSGKVWLGQPFREEVRYWRLHMSSWNGLCRWRAPSASPLVFASDASTSGFAYGLEQCPAHQLQSLESSFVPGTVRVGVWSAQNGDLQRQQSSRAIQWGEFFCTVAAAVEYGPRLRNQHVVFVIDNQSDVAVLNRLRTREARVAQLLRALCDHSLRYNFTFAAVLVHRAGVDNVLMDWASRPGLHKFVSAPAPGQLASLAPAGGLGGGVACTRFPSLLFSPLTLSPTSAAAV